MKQKKISWFRELSLIEKFLFLAASLCILFMINWSLLTSF
jgi:hypothetical protein